MPDARFGCVVEYLKGSFLLRSWLFDDRNHKKEPDARVRCASRRGVRAGQGAVRGDPGVAGRGGGRGAGARGTGGSARRAGPGAGGADGSGAAGPAGGWGLVRLMFQGQLDLRALREQRRQDVAGPEGAMRTRAENDHRRPLATVFGEVAVSRIAYRAPGMPNVQVTDEELNLPEEKHSHGLRRLAAIEAPRGSYEDAAAALTRTTGVRIGKRQVKDLVMRAAADVDAFYQARRPAPAPEDQVLMLQADGKGLGMREGGLRPATAKAAAAAKRKVAARLSPGEKNGRKRMAEIAAVSDVIPAARTPADIIAPPGGDGPGPPKTQGKWLTAPVTDDIPAVIAAAFDEMQRRDTPHRRTWIALAGGNNTQIDAIEAEAQARGITVPVLIDFVHRSEERRGGK